MFVKYILFCLLLLSRNTIGYMYFHLCSCLNKTYPYSVLWGWERGGVLSFDIFSFICSTIMEKELLPPIYEYRAGQSNFNASSGA
jgi:hypothetical protein